MMSDAKRILVTGANGFVGGACVKRLELVGHNVLRAGRSQSDDIYCDLSNHMSFLSLYQSSNIDARG